MSIQDTFQSIAFAGVRFSSFTVNAIIFGLAPVALLVLRPAFSAAGDGWDEGRSRVANRLEDLVQACLVASVAATIIGIVLQLAVLAGRGGEITIDSLTAIAGTPFGRAYLLRLPLLAGLSVLLLNRVRHVVLAGAGDSKAGPRATWWVSWMTLAVLLLATNSFSGHAAVGNPRVLSIGNDIVHLVSSGAWFTGIIVLATVVPLAWRKRAEDDRRALMAPVVVRFSNLALPAIAVVAITGFVNSLFDVGNLRDLIEESYGIALSVKIIFFFGILALGAVNHFYVRRKLERGQASKQTSQLFRKAVTIELAFGLTIMGVTGVLTGLAKTRESTDSAVSYAEW